MTIIQKFEPEESNKGFPKKYIGLALSGIFILMLVEIWVSNNIVTYGDKLKKLSDLTITLNTENQMLENEIAKNKSLQNISSKSAELGFSAPESIQYIR
ncbi:hypothetical protein KKE03_04100 [Patescibacteria group bacterium]|nr:hypothetical protein [Patescibacteria group bacterium]